MRTTDERKISEFFKALSHPTRIAIVTNLLKNKKCVNDIRDLVKVKQPNISQHLSLLKLNGIVDWHQEGKMRCYYLKNPQLIKDILEILKKDEN